MDPISAAVKARKAAAVKARRIELARQLASSPPARALAAFLATPAGAEVRAWLEREFIFGDLLGETPEETAFNLGLRQLALELRSLGTHHERTGDDAHDA